MNYFSLIYGDKVSEAPSKKVIKGDEIATLLSAKDVLDKAHEEALRYKKEVAEECEDLKEQARQEGFAAGEEEWAKQIELLEKSKDTIAEKMKKQIFSLALQAAKKVVGRELALSDDAIVDIISKALKVVSDHRVITIYVNKKDLAVLNKNKKKLRTLCDRLDSLAIVERSDVEAGGCIIETEAGIINAQLENQWRVLELAFDKMKKKQTKQKKGDSDEDIQE